MCYCVQSVGSVQRDAAGDADFLNEKVCHAAFVKGLAGQEQPNQRPIGENNSLVRSVYFPNQQ